MSGQISPEVQAQIERIVANYPAQWNTDLVCAYTSISRDTGRDYGKDTEGGDVCHARIPKDNNYITINAHAKEFQGKNPDFTMWVAQGSPFAHGVLNGQNRDQILNHASVLDAEEIGYGGVLWMCKAFRHFTEDTWKPKMWSQLCNEGLTGLQAFIGSDILNSEGMMGDAYPTHVGLFGYGDPKHVRHVYDEFCRIQRIDDFNASRPWKGGHVKNWGDMHGKMVKKSDGWGGFIEVREPGKAKDYAAILKEIFEGNPANVK